MSIQADPFLSTLLSNPLLAGLVDQAAGQLVPQKNAAKPSGRGGGTATATATATATGGGTASASASASTGGAGRTGRGGGAQQAGEALGNAVGEQLGGAIKGAISSFANGLAEGLLQGLTGAFCPGPPTPPEPPPQGEMTCLKADASTGVITTPGGYTIQATSQFEWKVKGPDGSETRVWGDPHVETHGKTGGEKFDFKKDATFVLPDGTKINVKCVPWGNGDMTVTSQLEILSGGDRVVISDIDKGKGAISSQGQGPETFRTQQTFVAGKNVADWFYDAHEVKSNVNGKADTYSLDMKSNYHDISEAAYQVGGYVGTRQNGAGMNVTMWNEPLAVIGQGAKAAQAGGFNQVLNQLLGLLPAMQGLLASMNGSHNAYTRPAEEPQPAKTQKPLPYDQSAHAKGLSDALRALGTMFTLLASLMDLASTLRHRAPQAG